MLNVSVPVEMNEGVGVQDAPTCYLCEVEGRPLYSGLRDRLFGAPGDTEYSFFVSSGGFSSVMGRFLPTNTRQFITPQERIKPDPRCP